MTLEQQFEAETGHSLTDPAIAQAYRYGTLEAGLRAKIDSNPAYREAVLAVSNHAFQGGASAGQSYEEGRVVTRVGGAVYSVVPNPGMDVAGKPVMILDEGAYIDDQRGKTYMPLQPQMRNDLSQKSVIERSYSYGTSPMTETFNPLSMGTQPKGSMMTAPSEDILIGKDYLSKGMWKAQYMTPEGKNITQYEFAPMEKNTFEIIASDIAQTFSPKFTPFTTTGESATGVATSFMENFLGVLTIPLTAPAGAYTYLSDMSKVSLVNAPEAVGKDLTNLATGLENTIVNYPLQFSASIAGGMAGSTPYRVILQDAIAKIKVEGNPLLFLKKKQIKSELTIGEDVLSGKEQYVRGPATNAQELLVRFNKAELVTGYKASHATTGTFGDFEFVLPGTSTDIMKGMFVTPATDTNLAYLRLPGFSGYGTSGSGVAQIMQIKVPVGISSAKYSYIPNFMDTVSGSGRAYIFINDPKVAALGTGMGEEQAVIPSGSILTKIKASVFSGKSGSYKYYREPVIDYTNMVKNKLTGQMLPTIKAGKTVLQGSLPKGVWRTGGFFKYTTIEYGGVDYRIRITEAIARQGIKMPSTLKLSPQTSSNIVSSISSARSTASSSALAAFAGISFLSSSRASSASSSSAPSVSYSGASFTRASFVASPSMGSTKTSPSKPSLPKSSKGSKGSISLSMSAPSVSQAMSITEPSVASTASASESTSPPMPVISKPPVRKIKIGDETSKSKKITLSPIYNRKTKYTPSIAGELLKIRAKKSAGLNLGVEIRGVRR